MIPYTALRNGDIRSLIDLVSAEAIEPTIEQINKLIEKKLLVVKAGPIQLVQDMLTSNVRIVRAVDIEVAGQEYIDSLIKENNDLKTQLKKVQELLK